MPNWLRGDRCPCPQCIMGLHQWI